MTKRRGIALISILAISAALLAIISVGLKIGSQGVLFVSQTHKRNVALSAAEAGVYEAMVALQGDKAFDGTTTGTLVDSQATYTVDVDNQLVGGNRVAIVVSTGEYGRVRRTLRAELEPDSVGFAAISINGKAYIFDQAYVNAIASPSDPISVPGSAHSEFNDPSEASFVGKDFDEDGTTPNLHMTGELTTRGRFDSFLSRVNLEEESSVSKPRYTLDTSQMTSGTFFDATSLPPGPVTQNTSIQLTPPPDPTDPPDEIVFTDKIIVPKGVTLHIKDGNAKFLGGIGGEGQVVVDGDVLIRTDAAFDPSVEEGVKVAAGGSAFVTHPQTAIETGEVIDPGMDPIGDFFARMPAEAKTDLSVALPVAAPQGGNFFSWFDSNVGSPDAEFDLWYDGDGTDIYPGLTTETKQWLNESRAIHTDIATWASGT